MSNMKTPPATPMTRKLVKRMVEVEESLKEVLKGAASEYVIEIKIRKIPACKEYSPIHEVTPPLEDVQEKVTNASKLQQENIPTESQKEDVSPESHKEDVSPESQQEDISPESSLALALIEKEMIPSSRKLRRNGNRRSIKVKKFGLSQKESEPKQEFTEMEILPKPADMISEDSETASVAQDVIPDSEEATSIPITINNSLQQNEVLSEPVEQELEKLQEEVLETVEEVSKVQEEILKPEEGVFRPQEENLEKVKVLSEPQEISLDTVEEIVENQKVLEPQEEVSEPIENGELVSDCDDFTSDAEDVTFSEELTPDIFRSNIRSELAELAMELIGSEPALADLALKLATQELSPEPQSELVSTPDLPDLSEVKNEVNEEIPSEKGSLELLSEMNNEVIAEIPSEKESSDMISEIKSEVMSEKESSEMISEIKSEVMSEITSEKESFEVLSNVSNEVIAEISSEKESSNPPAGNNEVISKLPSDTESSEIYSEVNTEERESAPEEESEERMATFEEEKESSELLLSETNTEERDQESAEKQVILQEIVDNSQFDALREELSIVTLQEKTPTSDREEEKEKCAFIEETICEHEKLIEPVIEENNMKIHKEETDFEEELKIPNCLPESIVEMNKERNVIHQKKEPSSLKTHAPALTKKRENVKTTEMKYIGYIVAVFLALFYILTLLENSQAPPVYNV